MYAGSAYANMGQRERALGIYDELHRLAGQRYLSPIYESHVMSALGDHEGGFRLCERAYELRCGWLIFTRSDPIWGPLHADPRYLALLKKLKLDF
jgi:hypothetical protein